LDKELIIRDLFNRYLYGTKPTDQEIDLLELGVVGEALKRRFASDGYTEVMVFLKNTTKDWFDLFNRLIALEQEVVKQEHIDGVMKLHEKIIKE
jgi:hypothetical protein